MGYTTDFVGTFEVQPVLKPEHIQYLNKFCETRRMRRNVDVLAEMQDPLRIAVGLPLGEQGAYFVGGGGMAGQDHDASIIDYNEPPDGQPGLWCQWVPTQDGQGIEWDGSEKFYHYVDWLEYIVSNFLIPWGYTLNGQVDWQGEDPSDIGRIVVANNFITTLQGVVHYEEQENAYDEQEPEPVVDAFTPEDVEVIKYALEFTRRSLDNFGMGMALERNTTVQQLREDLTNVREKFGE